MIRNSIPAQSSTLPRRAPTSRNLQSNPSPSGPQTSSNNGEDPLPLGPHANPPHNNHHHPPPVLQVLPPEPGPPRHIHPAPPPTLHIYPAGPTLRRLLLHHPHHLPQPLYVATKDTRNTLTWQPSEKSLRNVELDEAGKLAAFRGRFGTAFDGKQDGEEGSEGGGDLTEDGYGSLISSYANQDTSALKDAAPTKKK
ncbi:hypothetical protein V2G26_020149 [Clonostachys chloroleuca]